MDLSHPLRSVATSRDVDVLAVLAGSNKGRTGRELARLSGTSEAGVRKVTERLVRHGLVRRTAVGNAYLFELNRDHLAAAPLAELASIRFALIERLRDAISQWPLPAVMVILFGSTARGTAGSESDVDVLVVRPSAVDPDDASWREQLDRTAAQVHAWVGNDARLVEFGEDELSANEPLLDTIAQEGVDLLPASLHGLRQAMRRSTSLSRDGAGVTRTRRCTEEIVRGRLRKAAQFAEAAAMIDDWTENRPTDLADAYVTLCAHAAIAAADVVCCRELGEHALGESHQEAVGLLRTVSRDGPRLAGSLSTILGMKTRVGYGHQSVSNTDRLRAGRAMSHLVEAARLRAGDPPPIR